MKLSSLILREILHRKTSFFLGLLTVAAAVVAYCGAVGLLNAHDHRTEAMIRNMEEDAEQRMKKHEDQIRKSMKGLGFNIYIFPEGQELAEVYAQGYASKTMPEEYVTRLATSKIVTVNHLLPSLTRKLMWPEQKRTVVLMGIRGEVPLAHKDPKKPLLDPVPKGKLVLGHELHISLNLKTGDRTMLLGREFEIQECYSARGNTDDITIWMNLGECQELLEQKGRINSILALECNCASVDRLGEIRAELLQILPGTQIIEKESKALARAEARNQAKVTAQEQVAATRKARSELKQSRESLAAMLVPAITLLSLVMIGILSLTNVRDRLPEIGILRATGVGTGKILALFLSRAFLVGLLGTLLGLLLAAGIVRIQSGAWFEGHSFLTLLQPKEWGLILLAMPLLACLAAWIPSVQAAAKNPAEILLRD